MLLDRPFKKKSTTRSLTLKQSFFVWLHYASSLFAICGQNRPEQGSQNHRPAKHSYSFFSSGAKIRIYWKFCPTKAKGSRMPLVKAEYYGLLRRVAARSNQGRNEGARGAQLPGRRITAGGVEKSHQCQNYFLQYNIFASERSQVRTWGAPNLLLAPAAI